MRTFASFCLLAGTVSCVSAVAQPIDLGDRPHYALGTATIAPSPLGLEVLNLGPSGYDGVLLLPHPDTSEMNIFIHADSGGSPPVISTKTTVKAGWNVKQNTKARVDTMEIVNLPEETQISFDYSDGNPVSLRAEYFYQGSLVLVEDNLNPNPPGGVVLSLYAFGPGATLDPIPHGFSWRKYYYDGPKYYWGFNIAGDGWQNGRTIGGTLTQFDHVIVAAESPDGLPRSLSGYEITTNAVTLFTITAEHMEIGNLCEADLNGDGMVDDADFVEFATAYNLLLCP